MEFVTGKLENVIKHLNENTNFTQPPKPEEEVFRTPPSIHPMPKSTRCGCTRERNADPRPGEDRPVRGSAPGTAGRGPLSRKPGPVSHSGRVLARPTHRAPERAAGGEPGRRPQRRRPTSGQSTGPGQGGGAGRTGRAGQRDSPGFRRETLTHTPQASGNT